jgi:hypothetical protein
LALLHTTKIGLFRDFDEFATSRLSPLVDLSAISCRVPFLCLMKEGIIPKKA